MTAIFVYGTLMRGQCREGMWPCPPVEVQPATVRAAIYDLGPYPALAEGDDTVAGELWQVRSADWLHTLAVLDRIEGFNQGGSDLYVRRQVDCRDEAGNVQLASTYFYADAASLPSEGRIMADPDGLCRWPYQ